MADYSPERGPKLSGVDLTHGVIPSTYKNVPTTASAAVAKRLAPFGDGRINCYRHDVVLPPTAPDTVQELAALIALYESQLLPAQQDLLGITTVRFEPELACHRAFELARGWAFDAFAARRQLPVIIVQHVPALAGRSQKPHCHLLWPVRALIGSHFSTFSELTKPGSRALVASEWADWLKEHAQ